MWLSPWSSHPEVSSLCSGEAWLRAREMKSRESWLKSSACKNCRNKSLLFWAENRIFCLFMALRKVIWRKKYRSVSLEVLCSAVVPFSFGSPSPGAGPRQRSQDILFLALDCESIAQLGSLHAKNCVSTSSCPISPHVAPSLKLQSCKFVFPFIQLPASEPLWVTFSSFL